MTEYGPSLRLSQELHQQKYRGEGESFRECVNRIANVLKDSDKHYQQLRDILLNMRFLPAGRIQSAIGSTKTITPYNCFVSSIIEDNLTGPNGIMECAKQAAETMRMGGGIGYDFSTLRPKGDLITTLGSQSSGPVSFMNIFSELCHTIASAGHRRGAQMGVLRIDHPDIELFIRAKQSEAHFPRLWELVRESNDPDAFSELQATHKLTGFNVSIAITDEFMSAVELDRDFQLKWGGKVYNTVKARNLWETIMRSTWDWAEPGILFIDTCNRMNNLWYEETLTTSNPCGEQILPPNGACLLGSFNLVRYINKGRFDMEAFYQDIPPVVRAMDNVIDVATYPLPSQHVEAHQKRRMGIGVTGLANAIESIGYSYGSEAFLAMQDSILATLRNECYKASIQLSIEKGSFPLYDSTRYPESEFIQTLPDSVQDAIKTHGIRNSHLTSIAPTGTISLTADNISSGIEPVFAHEYQRTMIEFDGPRTEIVQDYGLKHFNVRGKISEECTIDDHLSVLLTAQKYMDSAVSKTCNISPDTPWETFKQVYIKAWKGGAKGCTTFNPKGKRTGILQSTCGIDPKTGERTCE